MVVHTARITFLLLMGIQMIHSSKLLSSWQRLESPSKQPDQQQAPPRPSYYFPESQWNNNNNNNNNDIVGSTRRTQSKKKSRRRDLQKSPMPLQEISTSNNNNNHNAQESGCLPSENGNYGSQEGVQVDVFFFYQVEANQGITESQINGVLLDDIEITLLDFMIPLLFPECSGTSVITRMGTTRRGEGYVGMSSKPSDFVLRGFECTEKAQPPCFVVSGSMTAYTIGLNPARVQTEMRVAIYKVMESGAISATISRIHGVTLLDDSLNVATLPPTIITNAPTFPPPQPQQSSTPLPTPTPPTTAAPTTKTPTHVPTPAPTTSLPTTSPTTKQPTFLPSASPSTSVPTTLVEPTISIAETSEPTTNEPTTGSPILTGVPTPTALPTANTTSPLSPPVPAPTGQGSNLSSNATLQSTQPPTQQSTTTTFVMKQAEHKSAIEKVPIWVWFIMAFAICICCSYADLDDDGDDAGVNQSIRIQERVSLAKERERDVNRRDSLTDSEAFSSVEYFRKLYRQ